MIVSQKKTKRKECGEETLAIPKNQWGVKNYAPDRPVEDDDESIRNHTDWMKTEARKTKQNLTKINLLLNKTFADRRKLILLNMATAGEVKEKFPCLFNKTEVIITVVGC